MNDYNRFNERLTRLEQEAAELRRRLNEIRTGAPSELGTAPTSAVAPLEESKPTILSSDVNLSEQMQSPPASSDVPTLATATPPQVRPGRQTVSVANDAWIGKVGIGLVIIGAVFLFKLAVDSGWITPVTRVCIGAILGLGLIALGLRLRPEQVLLQQLLPGGGIAILHLTLFAAVVLYGLVPPPIAWFALLAVSAFGFWNARRIAHPLLAWVALIGGVQGVFTLGLGQGMPAVAYAYVNALVALALYVGVVARWPWLPWGAFLLGGGTVALVPATDIGENAIRLLAMVLPIIGSLLAIWRAPVSEEGSNQDLEQIGLGLANFAMPLAWVTWVTHVLFWDPLQKGTAIVIAAIVIEFSGRWVIRGLLAPSSGKAQQRITPDTFAVPVALLAVVAADVLFQNEVKFLALVGIAFGTAAVAFAQGWKGLKNVGVLVGFGVSLVVYDHLQWKGYATTPFLNGTCLVIVAIIAAAALLAWQRRQVGESIAYWVVAYVGLLGLVLHQLGGTPGGQALVSVIWSAFGIVLFVIGLRQWETRVGLLNAGRATLGLVVGKLFLIDLAGLSTGVKTAIFLLIGGLFLGVSYVSGKAKARVTVDSRGPM